MVDFLQQRPLSAAKISPKCSQSPACEHGLIDNVFVVFVDGYCFAWNCCVISLSNSNLIFMRHFSKCHHLDFICYWIIALKEV